MAPSETLVAIPKLEIDGAQRDHRIQLEAGVAMVSRYREKHPDAIHASMCSREILDEILAQPGCAGVRMYYAEEADGKPTLVLVGVDALGNDLYSGVLGEDLLECPPFCSGDSPLGW